MGVVAACVAFWWLFLAVMACFTHGPLWCWLALAILCPIVWVAVPFVMGVFTFKHRP